MPVLDLRNNADYSRLKSPVTKALFAPKGSPNGKIVMRDPKDIRGIGFHITGCLFGPDRGLLRKGASYEAAIHERAKGVASHCTVFRDGVAVFPFDFLAYIWHGNALNPFTISIEFEQVRDGDAVTDAQYAACIEAVDFIIGEAPKQGIRLSEAWAHRQSNGAKPLDPGPGLWKNVVRPSLAKHGLVAPGFALKGSTSRVKPGLPIPSEW